jgi:hypothetical protein
MPEVAEQADPFQQRAATRRVLSEPNWLATLEGDEITEPILCHSPASGQQTPEINFEWSGNTLLPPADGAGMDGADGGFGCVENGVDLDLLSAIGSELKEEPWMVKSDLPGPLSPLTPQPATAQATPFSLQYPAPAAPRLPSAACPFPSDQEVRNSVLKRLMSQAEGGTANTTLGSIVLSDVDPGGGGVGDDGGFLFPVTRKRTLEDDSQFAADLLPTPGFLGHQPLDSALNEIGVRMDGTAVEYAAHHNIAELELELAGLGSTSSSSKDVMARAVAAAAASVASGDGDERARPWACELCPSRFSIKGHLSQHNRYVHEKYRPHCCPKVGCTASFGTRFARSQHIWTVHERKKPFACEVKGCKASFGQVRRRTRL